MTAKKTAQNITTRDAILDATEEIMMTEGYAAVTSRRVAAKAGLKSKLLHYYFRSMDDLFIATFQRLEEKYDSRFARAVGSDGAIRAMWRLNFDAASTGLVMEFMALATHRPAIRELLARSARRDRTMHVSALTGIMEGGGLGPEEPSPAVLALLMASVARTLVTEKALGVTTNHAEMVSFVERFLERIDSYRSQKALPVKMAVNNKSKRPALNGRKSAARKHTKR